MTKPVSEASHLPIRWPSGPNMLVPIRYAIEEGKNAAPCSQLFAFIVSIIHKGNEGSRMAIPGKPQKSH